MVMSALGEVAAQFPSLDQVAWNKDKPSVTCTFPWTFLVDGHRRTSGRLHGDTRTHAYGSSASSATQTPHFPPTSDPGSRQAKTKPPPGSHTEPQYDRQCYRDIISVITARIIANDVINTTIAILIISVSVSTLVVTTVPAAHAYRVCPTCQATLTRFTSINSLAPHAACEGGAWISSGRAQAKELVQVTQAGREP